MEFTSVVFLFFVFPLFLITYYFSPLKLKNLVILFFSFIMLFWGTPRLFLYFLGCAFLNYIAGFLILKFQNVKFATVFKLIVIFLILAFDAFMYQFISNRDYCFVYFFRGNFVRSLYIIMFFMNNISFLLDAYKNRFEFSKNIINYFLYVFMFFNFYVGPVIPYYKIKSKIEKRSFNFDDVVKGVERFILGLFKVLVLAFEVGEIRRFIYLKTFEELSFCTAWVGALSAFFHFYFFYSGYCDMANGLLKFCGFPYFENFTERVFYTSLNKFVRNFNFSFTNYLKFYIFPWARNSGKMFKVFKYMSMCFVYMFVTQLDVFYFFILVFLEYVFLNRFFMRFSKIANLKIIRKIFCFILVIFGFGCFGSRGFFWKNFELLFGKRWLFFDKSLAFILMFLKFSFIIACYFGVVYFLKWLKKPRNKYYNLFLFIRKFLYLFLFLASVVYCLTV